MSNVNIRIRDDDDNKHRKSSRRRGSDMRPIKEEYPDGNGKVRWKNRRRMAWISLGSIIIVTGLLLFAPIDTNRLKVLSDPLTWFFFAMASIIGAYMGFTSYADKGRK